VTPEQRTSLPDDLLAARDAAELGKVFDVGLLSLAADRICALEEELVRARGDAAFHAERVQKLRAAIVGHRGQRDFAGGKIQADRNLWHYVADVPWGKQIEADG